LAEIVSVGEHRRIRQKQIKVLLQEAARFGRLDRFGLLALLAVLPVAGSGEIRPSGQDEDQIPRDTEKSVVESMTSSTSHQITCIVRPPHYS
jgi:hypothetical protein